ncbi:hypothetical protein CARUB_v10014807mg [Capsella rubella]|uniref:SCP domain-containing protein n=1 Tax=Capsella rubella TaxID=81985 RepID=R0I161_9BRAS|nr:pathogenesis-related protein 1 [Capsella rubella]EOA31610.1 hypothetical protein CARUB_v10014807mg [Capsella rubella]
MNLISYSRILIILAVLVGVLVVPSKAQYSPQDYVNAHNQARAAVGVGPIQWDDTIAAYALSNVYRLRGSCRLVPSSGHYGENMAKSNGVFSAALAVNIWVNERFSYNYAANTCNAVCSHYTQVVWRNSVKVGCARVRCDNGGNIISCNYYPRGNYNGQKPY